METTSARAPVREISVKAFFGRLLDTMFGPKPTPEPPISDEEFERRQRYYDEAGY